MSRAARIEYPGAVYHVISRGNYRKDLFTVSGSAAAFELALVEVAQRCSWKLHAYVIMSNHYHLCLETPEGNLVEGMRWLQGTFGNRFNRFTGERGHVFQGRYKALLLEHGEWLVSLVNYIHLNPVRAGIVSVEDLRSYQWSSFPTHFKRKPGRCLVRREFLQQAGFSVGVEGMKHYHQYLRSREESDPSKKNELNKRFCKGWAIAEQKQRKALAQDLAKMDRNKEWGGKELREVNEQKWDLLVVKLLRKADKTEEDIKTDRKLVEWKIRIAKQIRAHCAATNPWIANRLNMGDSSNVSRYSSQTSKNKA